MKLRQITFLFLLSISMTAVASDVVWFDGTNPVSYQIVGKTDPVVKIALQMFCDDMEMVTGMKPVVSKKASIRIVQGKGSDDGFRLSVKNGQILVEGHNGRGRTFHRRHKIQQSLDFQRFEPSHGHFP